MADAPGTLTVALPNGRMLAEVMPILVRAGIEPEPEFFAKETRQLRFATARPDVSIVRARAFDVATIVAFGAAQIGIAGADVLMEFDYDEIYAPIDLGVSRCRVAVAAPEADAQDDMRRLSHLRVATKYPRITRRHFARRGIQAECIKLNGAVELAPMLGLCRRIVDLVSTGATLRANRLVEIEHIADVTARVIVNRAAFKTRHNELAPWLARIEESARAA